MKKGMEVQENFPKYFDANTMTMVLCFSCTFYFKFNSIFIIIFN